jgi:hypothetical protein
MRTTSKQNTIGPPADNLYALKMPALLERGPAPVDFQDRRRVFDPIERRPNISQHDHAIHYHAVSSDVNDNCPTFGRKTAKQISPHGAGAVRP